MEEMLAPNHEEKGFNARMGEYADRMIEQYKIVSDSDREGFNARIGTYANRIFEIHKKKYGVDAAQSVLGRAVKIFSESCKQILDQNQNNNVLLVGKVQSGKTSNLEMLTGIAFDNGYNLMIIYGGYDKTLLQQTTGRFKKIFEIDNLREANKPILISTDNAAELAALSDDVIDELAEDNKPIIITAMKRPVALEKVNKVLKDLNPDKIRAYIIDDEGDQASLNTAKNKDEDSSRTYEQICIMKNLLNNPLYFSVTATPHANIFLDSISELRPGSAKLIEPGEGYCGGECYHMGNCNNIFPIDPDDTLVLDEGRLPESLREAVMHFVIASVIIRRMGYDDSTMIVHSHRNKDPHSMIYTMINQLISEFQSQLSDDELKEKTCDKFRKIYEKHFTDEIKNRYEFENIQKDLQRICKKIYVILKNSDGASTQGLEEIKKHRIYVGGDLLQRGVTFENLVTTYYTRWAVQGNMDTNLQRARWFGYRKGYLDICRVFTTKEISEQYSILTDIELELWEQFNEVQNGSLRIDEMVISAENTKQRPTRSNVVTVKKLYFNRNWMKQRLGLFDKRIIEKNNTIVERFINDNSWRESSVGRNDSEASCKYCVTTPARLIDLMESIDGIFEHDPFDMNYLHRILGEESEVELILMRDNDGTGRKRTFYSDNNINNIHQGPGNANADDRKYNGDANVVVNRSKINVQIHKIKPFKDGQEVEGCTQYMFAIFIPRQKQYYVGGENDD